MVYITSFLAKLPTNFIHRFGKILLIPLVAFVLLNLYPLHADTNRFMEEICDNGIDDDADGLIDLNDPDCQCSVIEPESLIPNPSFEDLDCCPELQSELDCASGWIQASFPTTDFIHTCGWLGWENDRESYPPPQPFPDGSGIVGFRDGVVLPPDGVNSDTEIRESNWKEYAGACLTGPMLADSLYRIEFDLGFVNPLVSPPINITFYGTTDCMYLPFGGNDRNSLVGCPTNSPGWVKLGSVGISGDTGNRWVKEAIEIAPEEDIYAIAIGPDCANNLRKNSLYYFLDNLLLDKKESFQLHLTTISDPCADDFALQVDDDPGLSFQWYKDGIALAGETFAQLTQMYGEGDYQVRADDGTDCRLSGNFTFRIPVIVDTQFDSICSGGVYQFGSMELAEEGVYIDTLASVNNCDSVVVLNLSIEGARTDTIDARIFEGDNFELGGFSFSQPGEYLVTLTSPSGCEIEVLIKLDYHQVYIPNVFSPNQDGINDIFKPLAKPGLIEQVELMIFDRWGSSVYSGAEWDGRHLNEFVKPGVYVYQMKVTLNDSSSQWFSGSITIVR